MFFLKNTSNELLHWGARMA